MLKIYIDGDAFPKLLKPIVLRQITKYGIETYVIANKKIDIGKGENIHYIIVEAGADEADHKIVEMLQEDDLVITADIENIKQYLAMRNLMESIREMGEMTKKGPKPFGQKDAERFANQLNKFLQKHIS